MMTLSFAIDELKMCKRECELKILNGTASQREIDFIEAVDTVCYWVDKMYTVFLKFKRFELYNYLSDITTYHPPLSQEEKEQARKIIAAYDKTPE